MKFQQIINSVIFILLIVPIVLGEEDATWDTWWDNYSFARLSKPVDTQNQNIEKEFDDMSQALLSRRQTLENLGFNTNYSWYKVETNSDDKKIPVIDNVQGAEEYFRTIFNILEKLKKEEFNPQSFSLDDAFFSIILISESDYSNYKSTEPWIFSNKSEDRRDTLKKRKEILAKIVYNTNFSWLQILADLLTRYEYISKPDLLQKYRNWYVTSRISHGWRFNENLGPCSVYQGKLFRTTMSKKEYIDVAEYIKKTLEDLNIKAINSKDCQYRPWYVIGCFFEFACVRDRIPKDDPRRIELLKFFPNTPDEFFDCSLLANDNYAPQVEEGIRRWLREKFAYPEEELQNKKLSELLAILKEQFIAVRPYHRWLAKQYRERNDEKTAQFIERFMFE